MPWTFSLRIEATMKRRLFGEESMADKHPYVAAPGNLVHVVTQFRDSFPTVVKADTLRKLGIAPNNESYVLSVLRFLGLIDEEGKRTEDANRVFSLHDDAAFSEGFSKLVKKAYPELFELRGEEAWTQDQNALITFFRSTDKTTSLVGGRQAATFRLLAGFSGHGEFPMHKGKGKKGSAQVKKGSKKTEAAPKAAPAVPHVNTEKAFKNFGLTVRIEINLPADGTQEAYDRMFKSIRENLLNE